MKFEEMPDLIKPKNIAKAVAGASLLMATSGEMSKAYGAEKENKTTIEQAIKKDASEFFDLSGPKQPEMGNGFIMETEKVQGSVDINKDASDAVEILNTNKENKQNPIEKNSNGNVQTKSISEIK